MPQSSKGGQGQNDSAKQVLADLNALNIAPSFDVRQGNNFIDEEGALELPRSSGEDEDGSEDGNDDEEEQSSGYDSQLEAAAWDESLTRVDDEDWEIAERGRFSF